MSERRVLASPRRNGPPLPNLVAEFLAFDLISHQAALDTSHADGEGYAFRGEHFWGATFGPVAPFAFFRRQAVVAGRDGSR